jgi:ABC-type uncharacterized transport system YnjBCD permease subunit
MVYCINCIYMSLTRQYLVCPPRASVTALIFLCMESVIIAFIVLMGILSHSSNKAAPNWSRVARAFRRPFTLLSILSHRCSIGDKSGLYGGQVWWWVGYGLGRDISRVLIVMAGDLTGVRYRDEILRPVAVSFVQQHHLIFQQDNARTPPNMLKWNWLTRQYLVCPSRASVTALIFLCMESVIRAFIVLMGILSHSSNKAEFGQLEMHDILLNFRLCPS